MKKNIDNFKTNISEAFDMPLDISLDLPKISLVGNREAIISNHKGIIEYSDLLIRINSRIGIIKFLGENLEIRNILTEEIMIVGEIKRIEIIS